MSEDVIPGTSMIVTAGPTGIGIAIRRAGDTDSDRSIVLLHGLGSSGDVYREIAALPVLSDTRLVLVDLPGHGRSERPADHSYLIEDHADLVADLIRRHLAPPVTLVGHSMGGSIAIACAHRHSDLVSRLVVAEPNLDPGDGTLSAHIAAQNEQRFVSRGYAALLRSALLESRRGDVNAQSFVKTLRMASPLVLHRSATSLLAVRSPTFRDMLETIQNPRATITGARTPPLTPPLDDPAIRGYVVPDSGHIMMVDNPAGFAHAWAMALAG